MDWMLLPYRRYADFSGRSRRKEFWMFTLFNILVYIFLIALFAVMVGFSSDRSGGEPSPSVLGTVPLIAMGIFYLGSLIPSIAVQIRRLHDQNLTGWLILINFVPLGGLVVLVMMFLDGTDGENNYGPDPKGRDHDVFT